VMQVLDDEGVVQIDDRWYRRSVREEVIRRVPLDHRDLRLARVALQTLRRDGVDATAVDGAGITREQRHVVAVGAKDLGHLQEADADSRRLPMSERLRAYQQRTRHPRPFTRS